MFNAKKDRLISNLLTQLNNDNITEQEKGAISNKLSMAIIPITRTLNLAQAMINTDNDKIKDRQLSGKGFLFDRELLFEDIINFYYKNSICDALGYREVSSKLTISELLLMGGVFNSILGQHQKFTNDKINLISKKNKGTDRQTERVIISAKSEIYFSSVFGLYIEEIHESIKEQIAISLGVTANDLDKVDFNLLKAYKESSNSFPLVSKEINRRNNTKGCSTYEDCILLFRCGDESDKLTSILEDNYGRIAVKN